MIVEFFITMVLGIVQGLFAFLPTFTVDSSSVSNLQGYGALGGSINGYVPENELIVCLGIIIAVRLFFLVWDGALFIYRLIPFNG